MSDDPRVEPLAKRMCDAFEREQERTKAGHRAAKWDELTSAGKDDWRVVARLALSLSLVDARVKVAREALMRAQRYIPNAFEYGRIEQAIYDLDALARELEPEPKEPTLVEAVEAYLRVWPEHGDALKDMRAALARAKGGQS